MAFEEDLSVFMADFGVPVLFAGAPDGLLGLYRRGDAHYVAGQGERAPALGLVESVLIETTAADLIAIDETALTVDGRAYTARDKEPYGAGVWTRVILLRSA